MAAVALETRDGSFYLEGKKIRLLSGAVHYFRFMPEYWQDVLRKVKAAGLNTVETYIPWNLHEEVKGQFNFEHMLDIRKFIKLAQAEGLYVLFRPGPYICSEWDFGGLPSWLLHDPNMKLRSTYKPYLDAVDSYFSKLLPLVADLQYSKGGPIIAVQIENEYGSYGDDKEYLTYLKKSMERNGICELFFTSDNGLGIRRGSLPGVLATVNFQEEVHGHIMFEYLKNSLQPGKPLMVMEFWSGWFDHWGEKHHVWSPAEFEKVLRYIITAGSSVNFYMFFGGTNFGFMNGANEGMAATNDVKEPYLPDITSYDYDAPLSECGDVTEKYHIVRKVLQELLPEQVQKQTPELPAPREKAAYGKIHVEKYLNWESLLSFIQSHKSKAVVPMEFLNINNGGGQGYGFILYRKTIGAGKQLKLCGHVRDRAVIYLNGKEMGVVDCHQADQMVEVPATNENNTLDIVVENCGRVNYAEFHSPILNDQRKGLRDDVYLDGNKLEDWQIFPLEFKDNYLQTCLGSDKWEAVGSDSKQGPGLYQAHFSINDTPHDTYLNMQGWGKGVVFINGFNIGRYWEIGPQKTLYVPGPLLKQGRNQLLVFEQHTSGSFLSLEHTAELGEPVEHKAEIPFLLWLGVQMLRGIMWLGGRWSWVLLKRIL